MSNPTTDSLGLRIVKYTVKAIGLILVFGTIIFFLWRVFTSGNPKDLERLTPNAPLRDALVAAEADGQPLTVHTQYMENYITSVPDKNYGYFGITDAKFIPGADQVQVLFRYNNSTIRHLVEDYGLDKTPDRNDRLYDVTLYVAYDLTPDNAADNSGDYPDAIRYERYHATSEDSDKKNLYNFRKLVFDGVTLDDPTLPVLAVYVDFYYVGDLDYNKEAYGTLPIYFHDGAWEEYEPSRSELTAIREYE